MNRFIVLSFSVYLFIQLIAGTSCNHDPVVVEDMTDPSDTLDSCDPEVIYFKYDVLPLLKSNCAISGCHNAITAQKGVILDSYENVINSDILKPFDLDDSKIFRRITETDPDKRMPFQRSPLSAGQIEIFSKWILQGAEDLKCDKDLEGCDTISVSFSEFVFPTLKNNCTGCHSGEIPFGGISLDTYENILPLAISGRISAAISWDPGAPQMPFNSDKLDECTIDKIISWVENGAEEN